MNPDKASRRTFLMASLGLSAVSFIRPASRQTLTVGQVIDRIKTNVAIPWREQTVDNLIAGTQDMPVKGIASTMMATLDVLQRAAAKGLNMVITHEPTFYSHQDRIEPIGQDSLYQLKRDFIQEHGLAVFHFHDHWHGRHPDGIATGMIRELGWVKNNDSQNPRLFTFPETSLARFAQGMATKLGIRTMRVIGDPNLPIKRVMASWGNVSLMPGIPYLAQADVLVVGETHEWELVEYVQDAITSGQKKALIIMGHLVSEQAGMKYCAEWLKGFISEVPVDFLAAPEPYWRPDQPVR
ncbi:Nif3-like dinuclear metal center hexameric protein [Spirosoma endophyticum]|uniref:Putative GTP cyclohydrolase 1 type 2, NIF3 family n=1 Tax=Spirosoma endophyticum TaxID=662367 RepID=A0A1I2F304_9BACT|nr:Nif3-like dinuclear metal center hexameric protein [Spirosoma endophyticum]SFE98901.1 Putative GTP cyclohydrolase 1 type 2, NIF3 family [Spirosoma endophyticum]